MAQAAPSRRTAPAARRPARRGTAAAQRRRALAALLVLSLGGLTVAGVVAFGPVGDAVREVTLPLRHEDVIRQQARDKQIDAALIASVIYEESKFRDLTSNAGARGLMQITPATAEFIAGASGGSSFRQADLATPQVNIAYGTYYLRYLLRRYDGDVPLAAAAYNAGETNVDAWVSKAGGRASFRVSRDVPFPETRRYVKGVVEHRNLYARHYRAELGL